MAGCCCAASGRAVWLLFCFSFLLFPLVALFSARRPTPPAEPSAAPLQHHSPRPPRSSSYRLSSQHIADTRTLRRPPTSVPHRRFPSAAPSAAAPPSPPPWRPTNWRTAPRLRSSSSITIWQEYSTENHSTKVRREGKEGRAEDEAAGRRRRVAGAAIGLAYESAPAPARRCAGRLAIRDGVIARTLMAATAAHY